MNLYEELLDNLKQQNKTIQDIEFVCGNDFYVDVNEFLEIAKRTNYHDGFGTAEIARDLLIVGKDWWLERQEYDGSEWFEFKTMPIKPNVKQKISRLDNSMWSTLKEINMDWFKQEYQEPIKLTNDEITILKNIDKRWKWIARDKSGNLYLYKNKPIKYLSAWNDTYDNTACRLFNSSIFGFIKWEDKEPYSIDDLLKQYGVKR